MKYVIQSCEGYEGPLTNLLASINFKRAEEDIIVILNNSKEEEVVDLEYKAEEKTGKLTTIRTPKNIWEWVSFEKVGKYIDHPDIDDEFFFFMHDTTWAGEAKNFWNGMEQFKKEGILNKMPNGFCYPYGNVGGFNMGWGRRQFVINFGKQFEGKTFNKKEGILLEHNVQPINGIRGIRSFPHRGWGPNQRHRGIKQVYTDLKRKINYIPSLDLYKAWWPVPWNRNPQKFLNQKTGHPNAP